MAFLALYLVWGSTYLAIRFAVESMPPFLMAATRHLVPGALLFTIRRLRKAPAPTWVQWRSAFLVGSLLLLGANGLVGWAVQWVPSSLAALLLATTPLCRGLLGGLVEQTARPGPRGIAGIVLGFLGVAVLVGPRGELTATTATLLGTLGLLAAAFLWAAGSLLSRRLDLPKDPLLATGMQMLGGGAGLVVLGTLTGEWSRVDIGGITGRSFAALLYLMSFGSIVGFSAYVWLLRVVPPAKVATYAYVNPAVAVFLGWAIGGETIGSRTLLAASIIVASVVMITSEGARPRARSAPLP
jgi:drug/metabolite transporter (DMT)-like permease